jgi:hypothetical protein
MERPLIFSIVRERMVEGSGMSGRLAIVCASLPLSPCGRGWIE